MDGPIAFVSFLCVHLFVEFGVFWVVFYFLSASFRSRFASYYVHCLDCVRGLRWVVVPSLGHSPLSLLASKEERTAWGDILIIAPSDVALLLIVYMRPVGVVYLYEIKN